MRKRERLTFGKARARERNSKNDGVYETDARTSMLLKRLAYSAAVTASSAAPAQYVKTNKSDYIDAESIAEGAGRPTTLLVPIETDDQSDLQSLCRARGSR
jgi:hypothetical protein